MKKLFLTFALVLAGISSAWALDPCKSGAYYNPETNGTGIDIQVSDETIVVFRYGYLGGHADYWVGATANDDSGEYVLKVNQTFATEDGVGQYNVGSVILTEIEDGNLLFEWNYQLDVGKPGDYSIPWCLSSQCYGEEVVVPLFLPHDCE